MHAQVRSVDFRKLNEQGIVMKSDSWLASLADGISSDVKDDKANDNKIMDIKRTICNLIEDNVLRKYD
ncbi:hypothetical protein M514_14790 [Trichuris suis]|uniref:Uncharacterized protein n=1 Tax=Trichuris suis TaxID=68888 RepID=A0A085NTU0_9BILA|nr:hypothetical protein M514_14790 [Trichuris suis]